MLDFNPHLATPEFCDNKGSAATVEDPAHVENICWQTRSAPLSPYENALADALQLIFGNEIYALGDVVERLNEMKIPAPLGAVYWTEDSFCAEIARLAV